MSSRPIYCDYAAATPTDPRVIQSMVSCLSLDGAFANPHAKDHIYGWEAAEAVEQARCQVASLIGADPLEITFTSGATESNNLAIFGLAAALRNQGDPRRHIVTSKVEHKAVLEAYECLERQGYRVTYLTPEKDGAITVSMLEDAIDDDTFLVSLVHANSVLGTLNDIDSLSSCCKAHGVFFHTDAAQSAGFVDIDFDKSDVALATLTSEKVCGPKGVGALYVKRSLKLKLEPMIMGGGQEKGLRGGTVPTHQVAGMGKAFAILEKEGKAEALRLEQMRRRLCDALMKMDGVIVNGSVERHVPHILSVSFKNVDGHMLLPTLSGIAASTGSACSSANLEPSYVLKAIGLDDNLARASLRISIGRFTTDEQIDEVIKEISSKIPKLQQAGSMWTVRK